MTDCKFKKNVPKSITVSQISDFNCGDVPETEDIEYLGLDVEQDFSDDDNIQQKDILQSLNNLQLPTEKKMENSKKITNSKSLTMSKSRTKDELIPDNFTSLTNQRIDDINTLLVLKGNTDDKLKLRYS
jgi:hypothetical protein